MLLAAKKEEKRPLLVDRKEAKEDATRRLQQILKRGGEGEQSGDEGGAGDQLLESIIHRNIKVENILLDETHSKAVIADFGLSNFWDPNSRFRTRCGSAEVNPFFYLNITSHHLSLLLPRSSTSSQPTHRPSTCGLLGFPSMPCQ